MLRYVLRPMVKYVLADQVSLCMTLLKPLRLWLGGLAPQATGQRWRRPRVHLLPAPPATNNLITHWSSAVMKVLLVQPSSAAAERVFSILNSTFNDSQEHALVDYLQACVML